MAIILRFVDEEYSRTGGVSGSILLDLNDTTGSPSIVRVCLDTIEFPPPPPEIQWIEPGHADGRTVSFYKHNNRELLIKLNIYGTDKANLSDNIRAVYEQFMVEHPILEFRGDGWTDSFYFDLISPPVEINTDEWFESWIRDSVKIDVMSNIEFHVECLPWLRGPDEELVIFQNLAPNPDMEDWTGGAPDDWTVTVAGTATVSENTTAANVWTGSSACALVNTGDDAYITTTAYIPVDPTMHYQFDCYIKATAADQVGLYVLCYDDAPALLGTLTVTLSNATTTYYKHAHKNEATRGVIEPADFPAGTTQVKLRIRNYTNNETAYIDTIYFGMTEYSSTHRVESPVGVVIPPATVLGDVPAKAVLYFDHIYASRDFTDLIVGQRLRYNADYNPVVEFSTGTQTSLNTRYTTDYRSIAALTNILAAHNNDFEDYAGSGNTTNWTDWTEFRSGTNTYLGADTGTYYSGVAGVASGTSGAGNALNSLISALHAVDRTKTHQVICWAKSGTAGHIYIITQILVVFYDVGSSEIGAKAVVAGSHLTTSWQSYSCLVYPADMPAATTQIAVYFYTQGYPVPKSAKHYYDFVSLYELAVTDVECLFPCDTNEGRVLPTGSFTFQDATAYSDLTLSTLLKDATGDEISTSETVAVCDIGDADEDWKEVALFSANARWPIISIPSIAVPEDADLSLLDQVLRVSTQEGLLSASWYDCMTAIPVDKGFCQLSDLTSPHIILDSTDGLSLTSTDGTLDTSALLNRTSVAGSPTFTAEQDGMNLAILAVDNVSDDHQLTPIYDLKITYSPLYWMTLEE